MTTPQPLPAPEAIARLRPRRRFDPSRPLTDDVLKRILRLATLVPSQDELQPWRFVVVRDPRNRRRLRACVYDRQEVAEAPIVVAVLAYHYSQTTHLDAILNRRMASGTLTPEEAAKVRAMAPRRIERSDVASWAKMTAMRAEAALLIAAESLGVSSAPVEEFDPAAVAEALGIPADHSLCGLVALGYSDGDGPPPARLDLAEVCYQEHFGQPWTLGEADGHGWAS